MPSERKDLTIAIATAISKYNKKNPGLRVSETVISLVAVWRFLWRQCPPNKRSSRHDGTPGWVCKPPGLRAICSRT